MTVDDIKNVCVVGAGNMGHQISLLCAIYGYKTTCTDVVPEVLKKAENFADTYLPGRVEKGRLTKEQAEAARKNISFHLQSGRSGQKRRLCHRSGHRSAGHQKESLCRSRPV